MLAFLFSGAGWASGHRVFYQSFKGHLVSVWTLREQQQNQPALFTSVEPAGATKTQCRDEFTLIHINVVGLQWLGFISYSCLYCEAMGHVKNRKMIRGYDGDVEILTWVNKIYGWNDRWKRRISQYGSGTKSKDLEDLEKTQRCLYFKVQCLCVRTCVWSCVCVWLHATHWCFVGLSEANKNTVGLRRAFVISQRAECHNSASGWFTSLIVKQAVNYLRSETVGKHWWYELQLLFFFTCVCVCNTQTHTLATCVCMCITFIFSALGPLDKHP